MHSLRFIAFTFFALLLSLNIASASGEEGGKDDPDALLGLWLPSNGKARIHIYKENEKYYGRIVWLKEPNDPETNKPKLDKNNPEEELRKKPLLGFIMIKDFAYEGDGVWEDGTIYDPQNGSTYSCEITLKDANTIEVRGYIGVSLFGRTDVWKRLKMKKKK